MALINSDACSEKITIKSLSQAVRILNGLLADESGATALYSKVIESLEDTDIQNKDEILSRLKEIREDEIQHTGSLLQIISLLDPNFVVNLNKGGEGA